jgi:hypothetical protein
MTERRPGPDPGEERPAGTFSWETRPCSRRWTSVPLRTSRPANPPSSPFKAVLAGILFGILFGAANAYLGLRAGFTISISIPVAIMTVALFRALRASGVRS